ncbi:TIGR01777 family oxidoreductase [Humisphaera borealis]|uniref:TIGR01777 family protein n=1 Tax=Humisphaera borealis TaxID=2807512 RepID=A0A7M2X522_9BACT|nr:TIGR01777 family oxidoreductase [Humisphaera borealis]QOV92141.1 TIGR01777 family protein [Humisphaera borealis]
MTRRMIIPGGNGYLGRHLAEWFGNKGWDVTVLSRSPSGSSVARVLPWDGRTPGRWTTELDGADVVLNLAGRTVNCRYNEKNKQEIYASRLDSTRVIGEAIAGSKSPPPLWINAASATIYRHAEDRPMDEATGEIGNGFSVDVCQKWEAAFFTADTPRTRNVALRAAMVMGPGTGGVFEAFYNIVRKRLGGTLGKGTQFVSWMHLVDFCRSIEFLIENSHIQGPINLSSPNPIPNREFMRILRRAAGVKIGLPATKLMLEVGAFFLRTETELLLKSRRVVPGRLLEAGFEFDFPDWSKAAADIARAHRSDLADKAGSPRPARRQAVVQGLEGRQHI